MNSNNLRTVQRNKGEKQEKHLLTNNHQVTIVIVL